MGTRSNLGILNDNGSVSTCYVHWDGYPEGVGRTLLDHHNDREHAVALIAMVSVSSLQDTLAATLGGKHKDISEEDTPAYTYDSVETWAKADPLFIEHLYLWKNGEWWHSPSGWRGEGEEPAKPRWIALKDHPALAKEWQDGELLSEAGEAS